MLQPYKGSETRCLPSPAMYEEESPLFTLDTFTQVGVADRFQRIDFHTSNKIMGITESGKSIQFNTTLSDLPNFDAVDPQDYSWNHSFNVSQLTGGENDGECLLRAKVRGVGGGLWFKLTHSQFDFTSAARTGNVSLVREFIANGFDPNTVLAMAIIGGRHDDEKGNLDCVKVLVDAGAKYDYFYIDNANLKNSPIYNAVQFKRPEILEYLLKKGAKQGLEAAINICSNVHPCDSKMLSLLVPDRAKKVEDLSTKISQRAIVLTRSPTPLSQVEEMRCEGIARSACIASKYIDYLATRNADSKQPLHSPTVHEEIAERLAAEIRLHKDDDDNSFKKALEDALPIMEKEDRKKYPFVCGTFYGTKVEHSTYTVYNGATTMVMPRTTVSRVTHDEYIA